MSPRPRRLDGRAARRRRLRRARPCAVATNSDRHAEPARPAPTSTTTSSGQPAGVAAASRCGPRTLPRPERRRSRHAPARRAERRRPATQRDRRGQRAAATAAASARRGARRRAASPAAPVASRRRRLELTFARVRFTVSRPRAAGAVRGIRTAAPRRRFVRMPMSTILDQIIQTKRAGSRRAARPRVPVEALKETIADARPPAQLLPRRHRRQGEQAAQPHRRGEEGVAQRRRDPRRLRPGRRSPRPTQPPAPMR